MIYNVYMYIYVKCIREYILDKQIITIMKQKKTKQKYVYKNVFICYLQ